MDIDNQEAFFDLIKKIVAQIPRGYVATYGQVANLVGIKDARIVARAISGNKNPRIPCHRVVLKDGGLATNYTKGDWQQDRMKLQAEGVTFISHTCVDLAKHQWKP